jgi:hypothetical protein
MPLIHYICKCGISTSKFYRFVKEIFSELECECGLKMRRQLSSPSNASKITVDNGVQAKSVEVDLNVVESNQENSTKDFREE